MANLHAGMYRTILIAVASVIFCFIDASGEDGLRDRVLGAMVMMSTFDDVTDLNLSSGEGFIWTGESLADARDYRNILQHERRSDVSIAEGAGRINKREQPGDSLRFRNVAPKVLFYKGEDFRNQQNPQPPDWSVTIACWIRVDLSQQAANRSSFPLQLTQPVSSGPTVSIQFTTNDDDPSMRLVANKKSPETATAANVLVRVKRPPVSETKWMHVALTIEHANTDNQIPGAATLFVDGRRMGRGEMGFPMNCDLSVASLVLGHQFIGDLDDLYVFGRSLSTQEIRWLYEQPSGAR